MKGMHGEGETAASVIKQSGSRLLAETPATPASATSAKKPSDNRPLDPTVAAFMPVPRRHLALESPESGIMTRCEEDPLINVGLRSGALVDRTYRVERALGVGGMGVVALAHDERLDRRVAIKFIKPELFAFPEMRTYFDNEARAMARVSHPNVLQVYAFGEHERTPYFVMEYVDGHTVEQWLKSRAPGTMPDIAEAVRILDQAMQGVEAIHATSTVHRDLKPSNLLVDASFRVAVGDLGVARILESSSSGNVIVGSASYMAPEAALGEDEAPELASRRDIYALGCMAYELLTGRPPFVGATDMNILSQHVLQEPLPPSTHREDLPPGYDSIILRALAKDPLKRWDTVAQFRKALLAEYSGTREPERILIADDDPDWREIIKTALAERFPEAEIDMVGDGEAALSAFEKKPYSVVLVDLEMPEIDGAKLTLILRSHEESQQTPIIVLTAAGGPKEWQRLSAIGADAFLVKPVNADDVELVIRRALRSRHAPASTPRPSLPLKGTLA
jgi:eukaryotic-like serine/threonine-protein kinase